MPTLLELGALLLAPMKRPGAYVGAGALAIVAAIVANALFLQPRPHPAPFFVDNESIAPAPSDATLVRDIQDALGRSGRYLGPVDGIAGPQTAAAIRIFETSTGRAPTGEATPELLAAIRAARLPAKVTGPEAARKVEAMPADPLVAAVQNALSLSAYGPLIADGVAGPETRDAIMRFQRDHNLPVTGEVSDGLVVELRAAGAINDGG